MRALERAGLIALLLVTLVGFAIYPSWPNYDTIYSLIWGRELVHLHHLSFEGFRAPTEHPLAVAFSAVLWPLGDLAPRTIVLATLLSFVALVAGIYRLGRDAFTPLVGLAAALIVLSRFDFPYLAIRAYIDIPYVAAVVWAAVLEYERPRRGGPVWVLLVCAALLRPEGWGLIALYWLWMAVGWRWVGPGRPAPRQVAGWAAIAVAAPAIWVLTDLAVTGDAFFSFNSSGNVVNELGRNRSIPELPGALLSGFTELAKPPVLLAALLGLALAIWFVPRRVPAPAILVALGTATFLAIGAAGLAVIDRYLVLAAVAACVFAGFAVAGFTTLRPGALRVAWTAGAGVVVLAVIAFTFTRTLQLRGFNDELVFRSDAQGDLERVLDSPAVRRARAAGCGPISTPSHKLIPNVRWTEDLGPDDVVARSDPDQRARARHGIALYPQGRLALVNQSFDPDTEAITQVPPAGFRRIASDRYFAVFANCG
jgi:hypothetical protein